MEELMKVPDSVIIKSLQDEVKAIIKEQGLVISMRLDSGETVWDTPDKAYQERWQGTKIDDEFVI